MIDLQDSLNESLRECFSKKLFLIINKEKNSFFSSHSEC